MELMSFCCFSVYSYFRHSIPNVQVFCLYVIQNCEIPIKEYEEVHAKSIICAKTVAFTRTNWVWFIFDQQRIQTLLISHRDSSETRTLLFGKNLHEQFQIN